MTTANSQNFAPGWRKDRALNLATVKVGDLLLKEWADGRRALARVTKVLDGTVAFTYLKADAKTKHSNKEHTAKVGSSYASYFRARPSRSAPAVKVPVKTLKAAVKAKASKYSW